MLFGSQQMSPPTEPTLHARPTLRFRVHDWQDRANREEFRLLYRRLIYGRARRAGLEHTEADAVGEDVLKRVAETIKDFDANPEREPFRSWLMTLTHWRIADKFESKGKLPVHSPSPAGPIAQRAARGLWGGCHRPKTRKTTGIASGSNTCWRWRWSGSRGR